MQTVTDAALSAMERAVRCCPAFGTRWRHFRGTHHLVVGPSLRESDLEPMVLYRPADATVDHVLFTRPLCEWGQVVAREGGKVIRRFTQVVTPNGSGSIEPAEASGRAS